MNFNLVNVLQNNSQQAKAIHRSGVTEDIDSNLYET